ncbi:hypothetical protein TNCV_4919681 [Trichonephila clavipes]|nr:hypothetical protein TNCV_4919681 [Trichonephila clavipes]
MQVLLMHYGCWQFIIQTKPEQPDEEATYKEKLNLQLLEEARFRERRILLEQFHFKEVEDVTLAAAHGDPNGKNEESHKIQFRASKWHDAMDKEIIRIEFEEIENAEEDMPLCRFRRQYEQLSQFERGRIIGMMEGGWSAKQVSRRLGESDCVVKRF